MDDEVVLLYTTWPDAETAEAFGALAVAEQLAACANVISGMRSIYRWEGAVERAAETVMILKTTAALSPSLTERLVGEHPYDTPCAVALPVSTVGSNPTFLGWVAANAAL